MGRLGPGGPRDVHAAYGLAGLRTWGMRATDGGKTTLALSRPCRLHAAMGTGSVSRVS